MGNTKSTNNTGAETFTWYHSDITDEKREEIKKRCLDEKMIVVLLPNHLRPENFTIDDKTMTVESLSGKFSFFNRPKKHYSTFYDVSPGIYEVILGNTTTTPY